MPAYRSDRLFSWINNFIMIVLGITMLMPVVHLGAVSVSLNDYAEAKTVYLWPRGFDLGSYKVLIAQPRIWRSMINSVLITIGGTAICLGLTTTLSYALSRVYMPFRGFFLKFILLTFIFTIPLIPFFLTVYNFGMMNSLWALMIPTATSAYYVFIMKTFFQGLSIELFESARMDGCSEYGLLTRMALPLSLPVVATIGLFHAVHQWNSYFYAIIFVRDSVKYPIQMLVREMVILDKLQTGLSDFHMEEGARSGERIRAAIVMFATFPILLIYPFLQRYFVKGAMLGSLKE